VHGLTGRRIASPLSHVRDRDNLAPMAALSRDLPLDRDKIPRIVIRLRPDEAGMVSVPCPADTLYALKSA
jgi:hypothetical protein